MDLQSQLLNNYRDTILRITRVMDATGTQVNFISVRREAKTGNIRDIDLVYEEENPLDESF